MSPLAYKLPLRQHALLGVGTLLTRHHVPHTAPARRMGVLPYLRTPGLPVSCSPARSTAASPVIAVAVRRQRMLVAPVCASKDGRGRRPPTRPWRPSNWLQQPVRLVLNLVMLFFFVRLWPNGSPPGLAETEAMTLHVSALTGGKHTPGVWRHRGCCKRPAAPAMESSRLT